jgi:hypothetical protein
VTGDQHNVPPIEEILDRIPDALERTQEGLEQAQRGEGVSLDALAEQPPQAPGSPAR